MKVVGKIHIHLENTDITIYYIKFLHIVNIKPI